uniref:SAP domain-containing protein n=1 Tax=Ditylenchus dipsaci TaxID=166011 RepID=A0A915DQP5_9BILA
MPSPEAFAVIEQGLKDQLAAKLAAIDAEQFPMEPAENANGAANAAAGETAATANTTANESGVSEEANTEDPTGDKATEANTGKAADASGVAKKTCWSQLNVKTMKVAELREELDARGIDSKGVKNTLCQRLQEALDKERLRMEPAEAAKPAEQADVIVIKQEQMDVTEKPAEELELVEKVDDAAAAEKAEKELKELEKAKEKFEKEKKERKAALERHYASVPTEPTVLVYPSKTAKGGKFDCKCSTLSSLLQYSLEDNKEASFEVFLFAEALREAIDRSKAFLVYHALDSALSKEDERKRRDDALNSETIIVVNEPVKEHSSENGRAEKVSNGDVPMDTDATDKPAADKPVVAKQEVVDDEDIVIIAEKKVAPADPRTAYKAYVNDMDTFSAFAHFDENVCGYIENPDVEEILFTLGIDFSRGDMQRLIKKLSSKERINYRNLTDKWLDKEGNVKYVPTPGPEAKSLAELAAGHTLRPDEAGKERSQEPALGSTPDVTDTGVVFYKGSVLNIAQTMELQRVMETERDASLLKSEQVEFQLKSTKEQRDYLDKKKKRLEEDLDRYKKKLHDAEKTVKNSQEDTILMKTSLEDCKRFGERIVNIVDRLFPPPKKEEKKKDDKSKDESKSEKSGEQSKDPQNAETTTTGDNSEICEIIDDVEMQPEEASEQAVPEQQPNPEPEAETVVPNGEVVSTATEPVADQEDKQATEQTSAAPATTTPAAAASQ